MPDSYGCSEELRLKKPTERELLYTTLTQIPMRGVTTHQNSGSCQVPDSCGCNRGATDEASEVR